MVAKIFGYCRVSTEDQSLALQLDALNKVGCDEIFEEKVSGAKRDRPELARMLSKVREGDKVVCWKLDRIARSMRQLIEVIEDLAERKVEFQSLTENIDTSSAGGKLVFGIFASLAEFERSLIRERVIAGLKAARDRGRVGGRPKALDEAQIKVAKAMKADHSLAEIAAHLGVGRSTIHRVLKTPDLKSTYER